MILQTHKLLLPATFVKAPAELLVSTDLTALEKVLWLLIKAHCICRDQSFPGIRKLSQFLGVSYRWTTESLKGLESKGWLRIERRQFKANVYCPMIPINILDGSTVPTEVEEAEIDKVEAENTHKSSKSKRTVRTKSPIIRDPEKLQALLDAVDRSPYRKDFPGIDVDALFARFSDVVVNGTAKDPRPNPYDYRAFDKAFKNWCEREAKPATRALQEAPSPVPAAFRPLE